MAHELEVKRFERQDGWSFSVRAIERDETGLMDGLVDVYHHADHKCRLASARPFKTLEALILAQEAKAHQWIDDWHRRPHSGATGFGEL